MTPAMCRRVARAMGKARPAPSLADRHRIIKSMEAVDRWEDLPKEIRQLIGQLERSAR